MIDTGWSLPGSGSDAPTSLWSGRASLTDPVDGTGIPRGRGQGGDRAHAGSGGRGGTPACPGRGRLVCGVPGVVGPAGAHRAGHTTAMGRGRLRQIRRPAPLAWCCAVPRNRIASASRDGRGESLAPIELGFRDANRPGVGGSLGVTASIAARVLHDLPWKDHVVGLGRMEVGVPAGPVERAGELLAQLVRVLLGRELDDRPDLPLV